MRVLRHELERMKNRLAQRRAARFGEYRSDHIHKLTLIQPWDFRPGMDFVTEMQKTTAESGRTHRSSLAPPRKCRRS